MPRRMEAFFLLALAAHIAFFSLVSVRPNALALSSIHERIVLPVRVEKPIEEADTTNPPAEKKVLKRTPETISVEPEEIMVIPVPLNNRARWIVELVDIPEEEEPEDALFVSERPSRVEKEVRAEETTDEPKPRRKRKKKTVVKKRKKTRKKPAKRTVARRPRRKPAPEPKPEPVIEPRKEKKKVESVSVPPVPAEGIRTSEGEGNIAVRSGDGEKSRKQITKKDLFPTLGELAQNVPPGGSSEPGRSIPGISGGGTDMPVAPRAPENFLPMVKRRGKITLLNAKSYKFSGFVRRVAKRIFDRFVVGFNPRRFGGSDYNAMKKGAVYEAVMNRAGRTVNVKRRRGSGSSRFDSLARSAVKSGAWDSNVPDGAECADGFVHYVFIPKIIPTNPTTAPDGSRVYANYLILAIAGLKECE